MFFSVLSHLIYELELFLRFLSTNEFKVLMPYVTIYNVILTINHSIRSVSKLLTSAAD